MDCQADWLTQDHKSAMQHKSVCAVQVHKFGGTCLAEAERIRAAAELILADPAQFKAVVVSAMGSHPSSPVKVTDLLLNMVSKAAKQDQAFLIDLAALQEKHVKTAMALLGEGRELNRFVSRLLDDIANLKAMLQAIAIGQFPHARVACSNAMPRGHLKQDACVLVSTFPCWLLNRPGYAGLQSCQTF